VTAFATGGVFLRDTFSDSTGWRPREWRAALTAMALIGLQFFTVGVISTTHAQQKPSYTDCILYGNVFTADGHLFTGADVHVRRATDKKPKWEVTSDRRGEFAIRVPPGSDYVIEIKAKGFVTQQQTVTAQTGRQDLVFHMAEEPGKRK
jgi:hypothetical protein